MGRFFKFFVSITIFYTVKVSDSRVLNTRETQKSEVRITAGELGFVYTVRGVTYTPGRISVSGDYYNNDFNGDGGVFLYLAAQPEIEDYRYFVIDYNILRVNVLNIFGEFIYFVETPSPVSVYDLRISPCNSTSLIVMGPSKSQVYYPRVNSITTTQDLSKNLDSINSNESKFKSTNGIYYNTYCNF